MNKTRWQLLSQLAESAGDQPLRVMIGSLAYPDHVRGYPYAQMAYGLVQCTRDLRPSECTRCLKDQLVAVSGNITDMTTSTNGFVKGFSCYLRYQLNHPIDIVAGQEPAPSPHSPQPLGPAPVPSPHSPQPSGSTPVPSPDSPKPSGAAPPLGSKGSETPLVAALVAAAWTVVALFVAGV
ncbi:hypothetical protein BAE44_0002083 [Dichanthelium oligosanthes]|uniref:Gnk2-homologous domain-containing protein n=1 Tax=Dichanthelium oligosanthes TaxID=888268 RepID=A0A1E5WHM4_9POAL|nr:hypothetical protein BAE44_0002083 [Dichanthelium oligosanthes]